MILPLATLNSPLHGKADARGHNPTNRARLRFKEKERNSIRAAYRKVSHLSLIF